MTAQTARFRIRTAPFTGSAADPAEWLLDWAPGTRAETIEFTPGFFTGWQPDTAGAELLRFAAGVYCATGSSCAEQARMRGPATWA